MITGPCLSCPETRRARRLDISASYADITRVPGLVIVLLVALAAAACGARSGVPRPFPGAPLPPGSSGTPGTEQPVDPSGSAPGASANPVALPAVVQTALDLLGIPYRNGGSDPSGFDCSGLVQWAFARHGRAVPREVQDQFRKGREIDLKDVQPGDLIFFETVSRGASHVGMVIGDGRFVHAPSSRGVVRVEPYTATYWMRRFVGARRIDS